VWIFLLLTNDHSFKVTKKRWQQNHKRAKIIPKPLLNNYQRISISRPLQFIREIQFQLSIKKDIQHNKPNDETYKCYLLNYRK